MAELHVVPVLIVWNEAISATKKRSDLDAILSWMPTPPAVPEDVAAAMSPGVVHPGQWVMNSARHSAHMVDDTNSAAPGRT